MSKLIIRYPDNVIKEAEFDQPKYRIGTADDNDLILESDEVEPHQAEIDTVDGAYSVVDVSENKSTTVNGKQIERTNLNYGDRISFGPVIGLFYPSEKSKIGDKTKLFLYMSSGAFVIILSISIIFFLTSKRLTDVVSQQIGEVVMPEEIVKKEPGKEIGEEEERASIPGKKEEQYKTQGKRFSFKDWGKEKNLTLPEPGVGIIEKRDSIAVPWGVKKLFFKKIPVLVESSAILEEQGAILKEQGLAPTVEEETATFESIEEPEEPEEFEEFEAFTEELAAEKGFFIKLFSPIKRIITGKEEELFFTEEELTGEEIIETLKPEEAEAYELPEKVVRPAPEDIKRVVEPLSLISKLDIPETLKSDFKEEPIYSENELQEFKTKDIFTSVSVSLTETMNIDSVWSYPGDLEEGDTVIRSGTIGKIDEDKYYDFLFGSKNGFLVALNGNTGMEIISQDFGKPFYEPVIGDIDGDNLDDIILTFEDGDVISYTRNLDTLWFYEGKDKITSLPLFIDINGDKINDIVITTLGMDIIALDGSTGFEIWRFFDADSETVFSPVGIDINNDSINDVVFSTNNGFLYAIDGKTGWGFWKRSIFGKPAGGLAVGDLDGDNQYDIVALTRNGILCSYRKDGTLLFTSRLNKSFNTAPSIGDVDGDKNNEIVLIDEEGVLRALEGKTRREKWNFATEEGTTPGRLALTDINFDGGLDVIYTIISGLLFIIDGKTGVQIALYNYRDYILSTPIIFDLNRDKIFEITAGTYGGDVFTVQVTGAKKKFFSFKRSFWITVNHDKKNTGYSPFFYLRKGIK